MVIIKGLEPGLPDQNQKKKQRSFQESPLYINGTLLSIFSQGGKNFDRRLYA